MRNRTLFKARDLTQARLKELLIYNPVSGFFRWRFRRGGQPAGKIAGTFDAETGYVKIYVDYRNYWGHRLAWLYMTGEWPDPEADHKNGTRYDNSWDNLREASGGENKQNLSVRNDSTTGLAGVSPNRRRTRWTASIRAAGVKHWLGSYKTPEEAHAAYLAAKLQLHPFQPVPRV